MASCCSNNNTNNTSEGSSSSIVILLPPTAFELPTIDPVSLGVLLYARFLQLDVKVVHTWEFRKSPTGQFPALVLPGNRIVGGVSDCIEALNEFYAKTGKTPFDRSLPEQDQTGVKQAVAWVIQKIGGAMDYSFWFGEKAGTRNESRMKEVIAENVSWPWSWMIPSHSYAVRSKTRVLAGEYGAYLPSVGLFSMLASFAAPEQTSTKEAEEDARKMDERITTGLRSVAGDIAARLKIKPYLCAAVPTSADAMLYAHLVVALQANMPNPVVKETIVGSTVLMDYVTAMTKHAPTDFPPIARTLDAETKPTPAALTSWFLRTGNPNQLRKYKNSMAAAVALLTIVAIHLLPLRFVPSPRVPLNQNDEDEDEDVELIDDEGEVDSE